MDKPLPDISDKLIFEIIEGLFVEGGAEYAYSLPIPALAVQGLCNFYGIHLAIWQTRSNDLQAMFPLRTEKQRALFLAWCVVHGQHEYEALRELRTFWNELAQPARLSETRWSAGISRLLQLAILGRPDLSIDPALCDTAAQESALTWYYLQGGFKELNQTCHSTPSWQKAFFLGPNHVLQSNFAKLVYRNRSDIQSAFDISAEQGAKDFSQWLLNHALTETGLITLVKPSRRAWPDSPSNEVIQSFGVNLIGYAYGELGIGEDVRMAAHSLKAANIPFTIINVAPGNNISQNDRSVETWVSHDPRYTINIICLTALEHLRVYLEKGRSLFKGRYNIGYWPWELHNWPKNWIHCFNLVDEVWASSRHIEQALTRVSTVPVRLMPMAVNLMATSIDRVANRKKYHLPLDRVLFVFSFDGNSYIRRKNPSGIVIAFKKAFPLGTENASLIIKCMRPDRRSAEWQLIEKMALKDSRITLLDMTLSKQEVMDLYASCDCFVSLHRAEGFGRGIAEAIALNLDVIATRYGGNVEFCEAAGAVLVPYTLTTLGADDYVESIGNLWAEPDLNAAATAMQNVYLRRSCCQKKENTVALSNIIDSLFSPSAVGKRYGENIRQISELLYER